MVVKVIENKDNNTVTIYLPRCPECDETMVKGFYRYLADPRMTDRNAFLNEVTFGYMNPLVSMTFVCKTHRDKRIDMSYSELASVAAYLQDQIKFESSPRNKKPLE